MRYQVWCQSRTSHLFTVKVRLQLTSFLQGQCGAGGWMQPDQVQHLNTVFSPVPVIAAVLTERVEQEQQQQHFCFGLYKTYKVSIFICFENYPTDFFLLSDWMTLDLWIYIKNIKRKEKLSHTSYFRHIAWWDRTVAWWLVLIFVVWHFF